MLHGKITPVFNLHSSFFFIASHDSPLYYDLQYRTSDFFCVHIVCKTFHRHDGVMRREYHNPWCFKFIFL